MALNVDYHQIENVLCNKNNDATLAERFRALFTLKNLATEESINVIAKALHDDSALLKHELTYCLGQMGDPRANAILRSVLEDTAEHEIVRHEAAEALGAIGSVDELPLLEKYVNDQSKAVAETCEIAIALIKYNNDPSFAKERAENNSPYKSVDPAPPAVNAQSVPDLGKQLMDTSLSLFDRYRAMFALREIGTEEAVHALAKGFQDESALFRHEIAYVFGQLQHPASVPSLTETLENKEEVHMVRHEAAEALGSVATDGVWKLLEKYKNDNERLVRESCVVALDMYEYETSGAFQYADTLDKINMHTLKQQ